MVASHKDMEEALAWAAGFIDGDGCFSSAGRYPMVSVGGTDRRQLERFQLAVNAGNISGPYDHRGPGRWSRRPQYVLQAYKEAHGIAHSLWPYIGEAKREQILSLRVKESWAGFTPIREPTTVDFTAESTRMRLSWAAGFFDAEGCFSYSPRSGICASITHTDRVLLRRFLHAVGMGKIYGPYTAPNNARDGLVRKPHFFHRATGHERVQALAALLWPWIGDAKRGQAVACLPRVRFCRRGHPKVQGHGGCAQCRRQKWHEWRAHRKGMLFDPALEIVE